MLRAKRQEPQKGFQAEAARDALVLGRGKMRELPVATLDTLFERMEKSRAHILGFSLKALRGALKTGNTIEQVFLLGIFKDGILSTQTAHLALDKIIFILNEVPRQKAKPVIENLANSFNALGKFGGGGLREWVTKNEGLDSYIASHATKFADFAQRLRT